MEGEEAVIRFVQITSEEMLNAALDLCYPILGNEDHEIYRREAWMERFRAGNQPLVCAAADGEIVAAVLGRSEDSESLILGFAACREDHRRRGITSRLMKMFESLARDMGYRTITLGSRADGFYEKCGYHVLCEMHGQNIYQKTLDA